MISTCSFIDVPYDIVRLVWGQKFQVGLRKPLLSNTSSIRTNLAALTLSFELFPSPQGLCHLWDIIGVVQLAFPSICCTSRMSMLGIYWILTCSFMMMSAEAALARLFASMFSSFGIWWNLADVKLLVQCLTLFKYLFIRSSLTSHASFT